MSRNTRVVSAVMLIFAGAALSHRLDALVDGKALAPNLVWAVISAGWIAWALWLNLRGELDTKPTG